MSDIWTWLGTAALQFPVLNGRIISDGQRIRVMCDKFAAGGYWSLAPGVWDPRTAQLTAAPLPTEIMEKVEHVFGTVQADGQRTDLASPGRYAGDHSTEPCTHVTKEFWLPTDQYEWAMSVGGRPELTLLERKQGAYILLRWADRWFLAGTINRPVGFV